MIKTIDLSIESHASALLVACKDKYRRWKFMPPADQLAAKRKVERIISMYLGAHGLGLQPEPLTKEEMGE